LNSIPIFTLPKKIGFTLAFVIIILCFSTISIGFGLTYSKGINATGLITYVQGNWVAVDPSQIIGINDYSMGFQLDGPDIKIWRDNAVFRELARGANFKFVRFFEHRMGRPCIYWDETTKSGKWNWKDIDLLVKRIFEIGAEPLIVLGFYSWSLNKISSAPEGMRSNPVTGLPYPDQWGAYCAEWVKHFKEVNLPVRYYEIINEPHHYFGWGRYANETKIGYYMELYNSAAISMKKENPEVKLGNDNSLLKKVFDYFVAYGENLDFLSFHRYGLDSKTQTDAEAINAAETKYLSDNLNMYSPENAKQIYRRMRGVDLPVILSEGNLCDDYDPVDPRTHMMLGAVYTALSIRTFILKDIACSIYFIFGGSEGDMGMVNTNTGTPWYAYHVQEMIGRNLAVGDKLVKTTDSANDIRSLAWLHDNKLIVLLISTTNLQKTVSLQGIMGQVNYTKIDETFPWQNPRVQTGVMNSTGSLSLNGYAVALLQMSL
jgi:hypothetical protein